MRLVLLIVTVIFVLGVAGLAIDDMCRNGVRALDVIAVLLVALMGMPIIGALISRDGEDIEAKVAEGQKRRRIWDGGNRI